ncbi:MAG TPA: aspartate-semialdehyde dehydrogenase, partial [Thermoanaerobaculia bacterium]|nr:aspartate-semialdehyde dehydrogenase [Thermoanaerobaculia bacterium]
MTATLPIESSATPRATERIPVAILGATGSVGQRFIQLLERHPWFRVHEVVASDRSAGKSYGQAADWRLESLVPDDVAGMTVKSLGAELESRLLFSGLDSSVAGEAEDDYANRGCAVISNSRNHRMDDDVPLLIPEINSDHLDAVEAQRKKRGGYIVTNPNCSVMGLAIALAPLERAFGVEAVHVTTMQAISGAGYAGVPSYAILDNVIPFIGGGEEDKIEKEPRKILGQWNGGFVDAPMTISAQVNRVPTMDGHLMTISVKLRDRASIEDVRRAI